MELYAKSLVRIKDIFQSKKVLRQREIKNDSKYVLRSSFCDLISQNTSQYDSLEDADSLAFLHELFGNK